MNPKIVSFIWKQATYLRAAGYIYDRSFIQEMTALQQDLLNQPHIIHEASNLFFGKYFPKDPAFFSAQFRQESVKISTLNPHLLTAALHNHKAEMAELGDSEQRRRRLR